MKDHSKEIIEIVDNLMDYLKEELEGHDTYRITDIEMIVLLAVTTGYKAALKIKTTENQLK